MNRRNGIVTRECSIFGKVFDFRRQDGEESRITSIVAGAGNDDCPEEEWRSLEASRACLLNNTEMLEVFGVEDGETVLDGSCWNSDIADGAWFEELR